MAQLNIDFGTFPDDPSADAIRTAFEKVQRNFNEVFTGAESAKVLSVNKLPGAGITVSAPTGNVVITANIACVQVSTSSLSIGKGANGSQYAVITGSTQVLVIDLPPTIITENMELSGYANIVGNITVGNLITSGNATFGNLSTTGSFVATGNITGGNLSTSGLLSVTGNISGGNINGPTFGPHNGTVGATTANTGNFTTVVGSGNITGGNLVTAGVLSVTGNANVGNLGTAGLVVATGNITGGNLVSTGVLSVTGNANVGNLGTAGLVVATGNISGGNLGTGGMLSVTGNANIGNIGTAGILSVTGNANVGNIGANNFVGTTVNVTGQLRSTIATGTAPLTVNSTTVVANLFAANATLATFATTANAVAGANVSGAVAFATTANAVAGANVSGAVAFATTANAVAGGNVSGQVANALVASTVYTNAQPNITSVGLLSGLVVGNGTANTTFGNGIFTATGNANVGNIGAVNFVGTTVNVTGQLISTVSTGTAPLVVSSTTTVANLNAATASLAAFATTANAVAGANVSGAVAFATTANAVAGANVSGAVAFATTANAVAGANVSGTVANATYAVSAGSATTAGTVTTNAQPNITSTGTLTSLIVGGNINASNVTATHYGAATGLTAIPGANVTGTVANATYAVSAGSATTAGTVTTAAQSNITSVGTLTSLAVTGNTTSGNVYANSGTVGASLLTGTLTTAAQPNVTSVGTLTTLAVTGNLTSGNANLGNLAKANFFQGDGYLLSNLTVAAGSVILNGTSNVSVAGSGNVSTSVAGNSNIFVVTGTGANVNGYFTSSGNVTGPNFVGNLSGTVLTAAQTSITSLGTLTGLNVNGVANLGNVANLRIVGTAANNNALLTDGAGTLRWGFLGNPPPGGPNNAVQFNLNGTDLGGGANLTFNGTVLALTGNMTAGNITGTNLVSSSYFTGVLTTNAQPNITSTGTLTSLIVSGNINAGNIQGGNLVTSNYFAGTLTTAAQPNITSTGTLTSLAVTGNITAANVTATHYGAATGLTSIPGANVTGTVANATYAVSAGSATTAGTVTTNAQPNITSTGTLTSVIVSGNVNAGNVNSTFYGAATGLTAITTTGSVKFETTDIRIKSTTGTANYGLIARNDSTDFYLIPTLVNDANGGYNNLRPFYMNLARGYVNMRQGVYVEGGLNLIATAVPGVATGTPSASGGTMGATTTYARIVALDITGRTTTGGTESVGVVTTGSTASIAWAWTEITGAISYRVYVGETGAQGNYFSTTTNSFTQTLPSSSGTAFALPAGNGTGSVTSPGYITALYLNMSHTQTAANSDTIFYSSTDAFLRKNTATGFKTSLALQNVTNESKATMFSTPVFTGQAQSAGLSASWGTTSGINTGAYNAVMGVSSSATWLVSGTSAGVFRYGIQAYDPGNVMRFYAGSNYFEFNNNNLVCGGTVSHYGVVMNTATAGAIAVDQKYSYTTASIILTAAGWTDSGISGATQLNTGTYDIQIQAGSTEWYTGVIAWYSGNGAATLNSEFSEIMLTKSGDGGTTTLVYCRVLRTASGAPKLQLSASGTLATYAYVLNFRRVW